MLRMHNFRRQRNNNFYRSNVRRFFRPVRRFCLDPASLSANQVLDLIEAFGQIVRRFFKTNLQIVAALRKYRILC